MAERHTSDAGRKLLSPQQAAEALGVSGRTLHRYEARGFVKAQKTPAGHRRYDADAIEHLRVHGAPPSALTASAEAG